MSAKRQATRGVGAMLLLGDVGLDVFAQIVTPGLHRVDLLALMPEGTVLLSNGRVLRGRFMVFEHPGSISAGREDHFRS